MIKIVCAVFVIFVGGVCPACAAQGGTEAPGAVSAAASVNRVAGVHRERRILKPGMVVLDRRGKKVGTILKINQRKDGKPAVLIDITGTRIRVLASKLQITPDGEEASISLSRSDIRTAAILNTF